MLTARLAGDSQPSTNGAKEMVTDLGFYPEPALPTLPAGGGTLVDPTFGTTIMRLTDANDGSDCRVEYSYWPTFNVDNTRAKALCVVNGVDRTRIWSFDPGGFRRGTSTLMPQFAISTDPIWSSSDPDIIYGHTMTRLLVAYNVATQKTTTVKDFSNVVAAGSQLQQMSMSGDDDVFAFHLTNSAGAEIGYIAWKRSTNTFLLTRAETGIDEVQVDKTGRHLTVVYRSGNVRVWDLRATPQTYTNLTWGVDGFFHHDSGSGTILTQNGRTTGVAYRRLATPRNVQLLLLLNTAHRTSHFSMRADDEAWGLVSHYNNDGSRASSNFDNEIFQVATDGSGHVRRIAHHRSVYKSYYAAPLANISQDGRFVAFSSNWGNAGGRRDVFVARIPAAAEPEPAPPPDALTCPAPAKGAFTGCYGDGLDLTNVKLVRIDPYPLAFDWGSGSPDPAIGVDNFSVRWEGDFTFESGDHTFTVTADDGVRLWVDGRVILDKWFNQPATTYTVTHPMTAGTHRVGVQYYESHATATLQLQWTRQAPTPPPGDTTAPAVTMTLPGHDATVRNNVKLSATATDNVGVVGIRFAVDGVPIGQLIAGNSATVSWDSTTVANGRYRITARTRDAAGNRTVSAPVTVHVQNKRGGGGT